MRVGIRYWTRRLVKTYARWGSTHDGHFWLWANWMMILAPTGSLEMLNFVCLSVTNYLLKLLLYSIFNQSSWCHQAKEQSRSTQGHSFCEWLKIGLSTKLLHKAVGALTTLSCYNDLYVLCHLITIGGINKDALKLGESKQWNWEHYAAEKTTNRKQ